MQWVIVFTTIERVLAEIPGVNDVSDFAGLLKDNHVFTFKVIGQDGSKTRFYGQTRHVVYFTPANAPGFEPGRGDDDNGSTSVPVRTS